MGIVLAHQLAEIEHARIEGRDLGGAKGVDLAPVGTRREGPQLRLDDGKKGLDGVPLGLPGEVDGERATPVGHAEPEIVGCNGAKLGDEEVRRDAIAEALDGEDCVVGEFEGDMKYSVWISRPVEGVNSILKWGRRSYHLPTMFICSVVFLGVLALDGVELSRWRGLRRRRWEAGDAVAALVCLGVHIDDGV